MVNKDYIPDRGDLVWINFNPQSGKEQASKRPAIILSPKKYNQKTSLALMCPLTTQIKGYPFEVLIKGKKVQGAILSDQVRSLDWQSRKARFIEKLSLKKIQSVQENIIVLITE